MRTLKITGMAWLAVASLGCQHLHLKYNTVHQARTLTDIYEQQVADNLAMYVVNPHATPFFASPQEATSNVGDEGGIAGSDPLDPFFRAIGFEIKRTANEAWTLRPVSDPEKLQRMKCAYQQAVGYEDRCGKCSDLEKESCGACAVSPGFYCVGKWRDVPKAHCGPVGHYCGTYVWIPVHGQEAFGHLVMTVVDYAISDPPPIPVKEVTYYIGATGEPVQKGQEIGQVKAFIPIGKPNRSILNEELSANAQELHQQWLDADKKLHEVMDQYLSAVSKADPDDKKAVLQRYNVHSMLELSDRARFGPDAARFSALDALTDAGSEEIKNSAAAFEEAKKEAAQARAKYEEALKDVSPQDLVIPLPRVEFAPYPSPSYLQQRLQSLGPSR